MVYIKRDLMEATFKRDTRMFKKIISETVVLSLLSSLIFALHRYLKERLTLVWRAKLTRYVVVWFLCDCTHPRNVYFMHI